MNNIPIYRAKKIDSDEYVEGDFFKGKPSVGKFYIDYWFEEIGVRCGKKSFEIDTSTLAIHFPDMIDSEGTKIFASLSEDGKGGSEMSFEGRVIGYVFFKEGSYYINDIEDYDESVLSSYTSSMKVTGIQE